MSEHLSALIDDLHASVADGDLPRAIESGMRLRQAEPSPGDLLDQFREAVRTGERERARTLLNTLMDRYEERRAEETARLERSKLARSKRVTDTEARRTLNAHNETALEVFATRAQFLPLAAAYIELPAPSDERRRKLLALTDTLTDGEATLQSDADDAGTVVDTVSLPPSIALLAVQPAPDRIQVGGTATLSITVGNPGDGTAGEVTASVSTDGGVSVGSKHVSFGPIDAGQRVTERVDVTGREAGRTELTVEVAAQDTATGGDTTDATLVVSDPQRPPPLDSDRLPQDLDGDGRYEDVNGNGTLDFDDVVTLFEQFQTDAVQNHPAAFDFNRNGRVDLDDVVTLFSMTSG